MLDGRPARGPQKAAIIWPNAVQSSTKRTNKVMTCKVQFERSVFDPTTQNTFRLEVKNEKTRPNGPFLGIRTYNVHRNLMNQLEHEHKIVKLRLNHYKSVQLEKTVLSGSKFR